MPLPTPVPFHDPLTARLTHAVAGRHAPDADVDGALAGWVRRARAAGEPLDRVLLALARLLAVHVRPRHPAPPAPAGVGAAGAAPHVDDTQQVVALVLRRAITEFHRD